MANRYDVAVVGPGLVGAAVLRYLSAAGLRAVGVGPGEPLEWSTHAGVFASHYDSGRITRRLDKRREWAVLAARAIAAYPEIEAASAIPFHQPVGVLMADVDADRLAVVTSVADDLGVEYDRFGAGTSFGDERVSLPQGAIVLREPPPAGFIDPRRMLTAQLAVALGNGAELVGEQVAGIDQHGPDCWRVLTAGGNVIEAGQVVVAAGPHADEIEGLPRRPWIDVVAETVVLAQVPDAQLRRLAGLPSIILDGVDDHLYIVPPTEYPDGRFYVKLGATRHDRRVLSAHERRAWMTGAEHEGDLEWLRGLMLGVLPELIADAWSTKPCLIPDTPTKLPYLEIVAPGLVMAVGTNGYAAKSADAIGAIASGLVLNRRWTDTDLDEQAFTLVERD